MQTDRPRNKEDIERAFGQYADMLFKICLVQMGNGYDAEDAVQDTFLRYLSKAPAFEEAEHEKAWLIRVATNICRDMQRFAVRHRCADITEIAKYGPQKEDLGILKKVFLLPPAYKSVIHLHYVEGYRIEEISGILKISPAAVKKRMQRGREMLRLAGEDKEGSYEKRYDE